MIPFLKRSPLKPSSGEASTVPNGGDVYLYVKSKGERRWYRCSEQGQLSLLKEPPNGYSVAFSLDEDELRVPVAMKLSYHEGYRVLRQERGVHASIINKSRDLGAIYGIDESVSHAFPSNTVPLQYLVDKIMKRRDLPASEPAIALVIFGQQGEPGLHALVIGYNADNTTAIGTLASNIPDFNPVLSNAIRVMTNSSTLRGLPFNPALVNSNPEQKKLEAEFIAQSAVRIEFADLIEAASGEPGYPREAVFRGLAVRTIGRTAIGSAALAATTAWAAVGLIHHEIMEVKAEAEVITSANAAKQADVRTKLLSRIEGLAGKLTLHPIPLFDAASAIWREGSKVQLEAKLSRAQMSLVVPNTRAQLAPGMDRRVASTATGEVALIAALRTPPPKGWTLNGIETPGDLNAFHVAFSTVPVDVGLLDIVGLGSQSSQPEIANPADRNPAAGRSTGILNRK